MFWFWFEFFIILQILNKKMHIRMLNHAKNGLNKRTGKLRWATDRKC
ncbi:Putative uncharacterized protein [Moritella viscosa]|uniref:Uncharacterized protein n=1 Tax=Moritella viscosa TaxID=80854 RepID=A0A1L0BX17_9GAMM|nr:Putative uncharacterized protein [Moritella viscosa]